MADILPPPLRLPLLALEPHPCLYLPGRTARFGALSGWELPGDAAETYHALMDRGFRRSGGLVYQPACASCRACVPIRVPVARFAPGKSQRRCWRRNADLLVRAAAPQASEEKYALYQRYQTQWHDGAMAGGYAEMVAFLYRSPVRTVEFEYRTPPPQGRLLAVGICDSSTRSLSSVYFYFDPAEARRGLGTYGVLREIDFCRHQGIPHYYLGYWVAGCASMEYKANFRPCELLGPDGVWREAEA